MEERLVDVLDGNNRMLHVFPVSACEGASEAECIQQALEEATHLKLVCDDDLSALHGRSHVSRGGQLAPVADVLQLRAEDMGRAEAIRTRAYFTWLNNGRLDNRAEQDWVQAAEHIPAG